MKQQTICIVTGSRADYGLFYWLMKDIQADPTLNLQITVTGMHLSPKHGDTWQILEEDGFNIDAKVETQLSSDTVVGVAKTVGLGVIGFADVFQRLLPDLVMVLGDRYEMYAATQAAYFARIPIAHIAGGDLTEGAFDEAIRHSITKMSWLHFVTNSDSAQRVKQLGESPDRIFTVGSPGIDTLRRARLLDRSELEASLGISLKKRIFLVTFHPTTLDPQPPQAQATELCAALKAVMDDSTSIVCTKPNADTGGHIIEAELEAFCSHNEYCHLVDSLGQSRYLSLMSICDVVIGNSSSGLYEAPSFQKPVVNIGDRQKGRLSAPSVIHTVCHQDLIIQAIEQAITLDCSQVTNPYGDGNASQQLLAILKEYNLPKCTVQKQFYDL